MYLEYEDLQDLGVPKIGGPCFGRGTHNEEHGSVGAETLNPKPLALHFAGHKGSIAG